MARKVYTAKHWIRALITWAIVGPLIIWFVVSIVESPSDPLTSSVSSNTMVATTASATESTKLPRVAPTAQELDGVPAQYRDVCGADVPGMYPTVSECVTHLQVREASDKAPKEAWEYHNAVDRLTQKPFSYATLKSENEVEFGFPYQGAQRATLYIESGGYLSLSVERGQFICSDINAYTGNFECVVHIRIGDSSVRSYRFKVPSDRSTARLEFADTRSPNYSYVCLINALVTAHAAVFQATFYQEGDKTFEFNVAGLARRPALLPSQKAEKEAKGYCKGF